MKITLDRINDAVFFEAANEEGNKIVMDGSEKIGGEGKGARPMQVLLMALGGCTSMDVLSIMKKMKQHATSYHVEIDGNREQGVVPAVFTDIHLTYLIEGENLDAERVKRAAELSMDKYCSVTRMIEHVAKITYSVVINGEKVFG
ncbi:MAG: OsmC family protein [Bacteroidetes bacterium]|nr:OsmC family protein [Bacteroidota bacterium]